ncbi:MAG TPA: hypothetical protein VMU29_12710 [Smithella sp.]|nr:hypothetical protein [Smithella sp.]
MMDILEYIGSWSVLKWVVLVLIAGFIGQFGKMTAEAVAKKIRQRRAGKPQLPNEGAPSPDLKTGAVPDYPKSKSSSTGSDQAVGSDKKIIKAMAKARKKEAKNK